MLFSSQTFLFVFLPLVIAATFLIGRYLSRKMALMALLVGSVVFYGWWEPRYLLLIGASIVLNFAIGLRLYASKSKALLTAGIGLNLVILGYYKYAGFFLDNLNTVFATNWDAGTIILPLAISFFTFQQVAYLVDVYQGKAEDHDFLHYCLFVTFFPQLIAGPIVHHKEMMPQFYSESVFRPQWDNIRIGALIFFIGLFKKVVIADGISVYSDAVFGADSVTPNFVEAWAAILAYTFQIYFDFSGYSEMAMGLARLFGIHLPLNFFSPYRASNIIVFWRHWHMTLSRFLRDYLYFPLGGNRKGPERRYVNLLIVMILGGLWHGAGWTFVIWGGLHGAYLIVNHGWHAVRRAVGWDRETPSWAGVWGGRLLTFLAVVVAWVYFRADSVADAHAVLGAMFGLHGIDLTVRGTVNAMAWGWLPALLMVVWFLPNTHEWLTGHHPSYEPEFQAPDSVLRHPWMWKGPVAALWRRRMAFFVPLILALGTFSLMIVLYRGANTKSFVYMVF